MKIATENRQLSLFGIQIKGIINDKIRFTNNALNIVIIIQIRGNYIISITIFLFIYIICILFNLYLIYYSL